MIDLHSDEKVVLRQRKHWFVFTVEGVGFAIAGITPFIVFPLIDWVFPQIYGFFGQDTALSIIIFVSGTWLAMTWMLFYISFTNYYLDVLVITDKRLIDIDQVGLFSRDIATVPFENIQDIKIETMGIIPTLLKYGDIYVQTAGAKAEIIIRGIAHPELVKAKMLGIYKDIPLTERD